MTLATPLTEVFKLKPAQKKALDKLKLSSVRDLLFYFPARHEEQSEYKKIAELAGGETATLIARVLDAETRKAFHRRFPMARATIQDETGKLKVVWFHQAYMAKKAMPGILGKFRGRITKSKTGLLSMTNPDFQIAEGFEGGPDSLFPSAQSDYMTPVYPESRGITSLWFYHAIERLLKSGVVDDIRDPLPLRVLKKYHLPSLKTALIWIHSPKKFGDSLAARKRFAFDEVFFIQLDRLRARREYEENPAFAVAADKKDIADFVGRFPFSMTKAQKRTVDTILKDLASGRPMSRLLEGDVGSGKTAVAAVAAYAAVKAGFEVAYMAPTEILARQHFESFIGYFEHMGINIGLMTGSECRKFPSKINPREHTHISRAQLLKWVAGGEIPILVGTHALIQKSVKFKNLALVVIDEQHRFGVEQRKALARKSKSQEHALPHLLSMTATPIPRTLALTVYGDLDITLLDEMPAGRKPVVTEVVETNKRTSAYEKMREELGAGRQAFVICPRIGAPDPTKEMALQAKSVIEEAARLRSDVFPEYNVDIAHGKLKPAEKENAMARFTAGETHILVSTSIVEVGVNVPNATIIMIEGAERFGLAQLHQLRGRVLRGTHQAYCFVVADTKVQKSLDRLRALTSAQSGFELAERDLEMRGSGELAGGKQWGITDIGMDALRNLKMVEAARAEAQEILKNDPLLKKNPLLKERIEAKSDTIHFE
jgi:ATP-dependent DNA helicase RecG